MKRALLVVLLLSVITGCASSSNHEKVKLVDLDLDNAVTPEGEKLYCKKEKITGSHRKTTTCMTLAEKEVARKNSDLYIHRLKSAPEVGRGDG